MLATNVQKFRGIVTSSICINAPAGAEIHQVSNIAFQEAPPRLVQNSQNSPPILRETINPFSIKNKLMLMKMVILLLYGLVATINPGYIDSSVLVNISHVTLFAEAAPEQFVLTPASPILNLPVKIAFTGSSDVKSLHLSTPNGNCVNPTYDKTSSQPLATDGVVKLDPGTRTAIFHFPTLQTDEFDLCDTTTKKKLGNIKFIPIIFSPQYIFTSKAQTFTFSQNTPIRTKAEMRQVSTCGGLSYFSGYVDQSKTMSGSTNVPGNFYMCVTVDSPVDNKKYTINLGIIVSTIMSSFVPQTLIRHDPTNIEVTDSAPMDGEIVLAKANSDCKKEDHLQGPIAYDRSVTGSGFGKTYNITANLPKGSYTVCFKYGSSNNVIYVPADISKQLKILEYGVAPSTFFKDTATVIYLDLDTPIDQSVGSKVGFSRMDNCGRGTSYTQTTYPNGLSQLGNIRTTPALDTWEVVPFVVKGTSSGSTGIKFSNVGVFTVCIKDEKKSISNQEIYIPAGKATVINAITATVDRGNTLYRGLSVRVSVVVNTPSVSDPGASTQLEWYMGDTCKNGPTKGNPPAYYTGKTVPVSGSGGGVFQGVIPMTGTSVGNTVICAVTPDGTGRYAVAKAAIQNMKVEYNSGKGKEGIIILNEDTTLNLGKEMIVSGGNDVTVIFKITQGINPDDPCSLDAIFGPRTHKATNNPNLVSDISNVINFKSSGVHTLCVKTDNSPFIPITTLTVYVKPEVTRVSWAVAGIPFNIPVSNVPSKATVRLLGFDSSNAQTCQDTLPPTNKYSRTMNQVETTSGTLPPVNFLKFNYNNEGLVLVCVHLQGPFEKTAVYEAGRIAITKITHSPDYIFSNQKRVRITLFASNIEALKGTTAFYSVDGSSEACGPTVIPPSTPVPVMIVPSVSGSTDHQFASFHITPPKNSPFSICVGGTPLSGYAYTGKVNIVEGEMSLSFSPMPDPVVGVPFHLMFNTKSSLTPNKYIISRWGDGCSKPIVTGSLKTIHVSSGSSFQSTAPVTITKDMASGASSAEYNLCVEMNSNPGRLIMVGDKVIDFMQAGPQATYIHKVSTTLSLNPKTLISTEGSTSLFLVNVAKECDKTPQSDRYFASPSSPLSAPVGKLTYFLCAIVSSATTGNSLASMIVTSKNKVSVINPYKISNTVPADLNNIRSFVPFFVSLSGGDVGSSGKPPETKVFVIPEKSKRSPFKELHCEDIASSSAGDLLLHPDIVQPIFKSTTPSYVNKKGGMNIMIGDKEGVPYRVCVLHADGQSASEIIPGTIPNVKQLIPNAYVTPSTLVKGIPVTLKSGGTKDVYGVLAEKEDCSGPRLPGTPVKLSNSFLPPITLPETETRTKLYFCESEDVDGDFKYRSTVHIVGIEIEEGDHKPSDPVGFENRTFQPATPITLAVPKETGKDPFVSTRADCKDYIDVSKGIVPPNPDGSGNTMEFYVCAVTPDGSLKFSRGVTKGPNLRITRYKVNPTAILSLGNNVKTTLTLVPPTKTTNAFFSSDDLITIDSSGGLLKVCKNSANGANGNLGPATGFSTAGGTQDISSATPYSGRIYICVEGLGEYKSDGSSASVNLKNMYIPIAVVLATPIPVVVPGPGHSQSDPIPPPVLGVPWCLDRTVPMNLYALLEEKDATYPNAALYTSKDRRVFMAEAIKGKQPNELCSDIKNAVDGTIAAPMAVPSSTTVTRVCIPTTKLNIRTTYFLCTGIPYGFVSQPSSGADGGFTIISAIVTPIRYVVGTTVDALFPSIRGKEVVFVHKGTDCSDANAVTKSFHTDANTGAVKINTTIASSGAPMKPGYYSVCVKDSVLGWQKVDVIDDKGNNQDGNVLMVNQEHFGLGNIYYSASTPTPVDLLEDLTSASLRKTLSLRIPQTTRTSRRGFSPKTITSIDNACLNEIPLSIGTIIPLSSNTDKLAEVLVTKPGEYVVCAVTKENRTMSPVANIIVSESLLNFPNKVRISEIWSVGYVLPSSANENDDVFLYSGPCCKRVVSPTSNEIEYVEVVPNNVLTRIPMNVEVNQHKVTVEEKDLEPFKTQRNFRMCVRRKTNYCIDAGGVEFLPALPSRPQVIYNASGNFVRGSSSESNAVLNNDLLIYLVIAFCVLLLLICLIIFICMWCCRRRRNVKVGAAVDLNETGDMTEWTARSSSMQHNSIKRFDMRLDDESFIFPIPNDIAAHLTTEESHYRALIIQDEQEAGMYEQWSMFNLEQRKIEKIHQQRELEERALYIIQCSNQMEQEEEQIRYEIELAEDTARVNIAEIERELWGTQLESDRLILEMELMRSDPLWKSRRRKLREANNRAFNTMALTSKGASVLPNSLSSIRVDPTVSNLNSPANNDGSNAYYHTVSPFSPLSTWGSPGYTVPQLHHPCAPLEMGGDLGGDVVANIEFTPQTHRRLMDPYANW